MLYTLYDRKKNIFSDYSILISDLLQRKSTNLNPNPRIWKHLRSHYKYTAISKIYTREDSIKDTCLNGIKLLHRVKLLDRRS